MQRPTLSICIPTYNRARYLRHCLTDLASVLSQVDFTCEIVISDNASTDDTQAVIDQYREQLPIVAVSFAETVSQPTNSSNAQQHASGEFIMYMGDDDFLDAQGLVEAIQRLKSDDDIAILFAPWNIIQHRQKNDEVAFYRLPNDVTIERGDYLGLLDLTLNHHIFAEIFILRAHALQSLVPFINNEVAFICFVNSAEWLGIGRIAFQKRPYYYASSVYFEEDGAREQLGNQEAEVAWDRYRGGLEVLLSRALEQEPTLDRESYYRNIQHFVGVRMSVALRLRAVRNDAPVSCYYLARRLMALGFGHMLPEPLDHMRIRAIISFVCAEPAVVGGKTSIWMVGGWGENLESFVKTATDLPVNCAPTLPDDVSNAVILLATPEILDEDTSAHLWSRQNITLTEGALLQKFP